MATRVIRLWWDFGSGSIVCVGMRCVPELWVWNAQDFFFIIHFFLYSRWGIWRSRAGGELLKDANYVESSRVHHKTLTRRRSWFNFQHWPIEIILTLRTLPPPAPNHPDYILSFRVLRLTVSYLQIVVSELFGNQASQIIDHSHHQ